MNGVEKRLLPAGLVALILHGAALSWQLHQGQVTLPTPLSVQRIAVSLGVRKVARVQPAEPKQVQEPKKKIGVLPPAKVHKQSPTMKPAILPDSKPRPVVRKRPRPQPEPETHRTVPFNEEQSVVQPPPSLQEIPPEHQPAPELAAPSRQADLENENAHATPAAAQVIRQATPLYQINPPPKYPRLALRRGLEGVVLLEALIDISGRVADLRLFTSSGHPVLDRAALQAVRHWRFTPGTVAGKRENMWVKVPIRFQLR